MRLQFGAAVFLLSVLLYLAPAVVSAQRVTAGPDTTQIQVPLPDSVTQKTFFLDTWDKPARAALFSAIIPGAGQVYNKAYWKVPIIYATGGVLGYFLIDNNEKYQDFRQALNQRSRKETDKYVDHPVFGTNNPRGTENIRFYRDYYRRNRDLTIMLSVVAYGLNIAEAYVHAHLKDFDISDDLSLRVQPGLLPMRGSSYSMAPGVTLVLYSNAR